MVKRFRLFSNITLALSFVLAAVFWLLSAIEGTADSFSWFGFPHAVALISGVWGAVIMLGVFVLKIPVPLKKLRALIAIGMFVIMAVSLANIWGWENRIIWPIIAVVLTVGLLFIVIAVKGRRWDSGDNQKAGYKNYHQRKAEKEAQVAQQPAEQPRMGIQAQIRAKELQAEQELRDLEARANQPTAEDEERAREERIREEERIRFDERVRIAEELKKNNPNNQ
ncbi:MAG: hypothetical protein FWC11_01860 [Firmicutes bacterium]|nr:hypothetical protein [Bacillota bacterium]